MKPALKSTCIFLKGLSFQHQLLSPPERVFLCWVVDTLSDRSGSLRWIRVLPRLRKKAGPLSLAYAGGILLVFLPEAFSCLLINSLWPFVPLAYVTQAEPHSLSLKAFSYFLINAGSNRNLFCQPFLIMQF